MDEDVESVIDICELYSGDCKVSIHLLVPGKYREKNKITKTKQTQKWAEELIESIGR
tara:strand:+ start:1568 stop:1738 length:171 start_codon:yes stop_codon:yes gene_type:complete